jgi:uncharacterized delta-60 repeat protein
MQISKFKIFFFFTLVFQTNIFAAGIIDQTFGLNGTLNLNFGNQTNVVDVDVNSNGKIIVAGTVANAAAGNDIFVAQYNSNGTLDTTFGVNGVTITVTNLDETISDLEIQPDGKIVLVGRQQVFEGVTTIFDFLVVRYNAAGQLDNTFSDDGFVTVNQNQQDVFNKVAVQLDGKIVAVGSTTETVGLRMVFRFNPNGTIDSTFQNNGFFTQTIIRNFPYLETTFLDVEALPDGRIVAGFNSFRDNPGENEFRANLLILTSNSSNSRYMNNFAGHSNITNRLDLAVLTNGNVAITDEAGNFVFNPVSDNFVKLFTQNGAYIAAFNNGRFVVSGGFYFGNIQIYSSNAFIGYANSLPSGKLATQPDGKFLILSSNSLTKVRNLTSQATRIADFGNDEKTNLIVERPSTDTAYFLNDNGSYRTVSTISPKKIIPEYFEFWSNYYSPIRGLIAYRSSNTFHLFLTGFTATLGNQNDKAIGGDYNGDGSSDYSVFTQNGDWISQFSIPTNPVISSYHWGTTGDKPVPADYDNDGITDYAIFRPSTGVWWIHRSGNDSYFTVPFGLSSDIPLTGDYDADGKADFVVYRPSTGTWYLQMTTDGFKAVQFGLSTDIPVPGDYDGDGKHDIAVFRNGIWYLLQSRDGFAGIQWGTTGDVPITVRYDN